MAHGGRHTEAAVPVHAGDLPLAQTRRGAGLQAHFAVACAQTVHALARGTATALGSTLVAQAITAMKDNGADEVVLETEITNPKAIALYEKMGFARDKMLFRYYLNGVDAIRLKLWLK